MTKPAKPNLLKALAKTTEDMRRLDDAKRSGLLTEQQYQAMRAKIIEAGRIATGQPAN